MRFVRRCAAVPRERSVREMNYLPSDTEFHVVEDKEKQGFFVNREVFVSAEVLEREQRRVFDRSWVYVGHASEVKNPGDFHTRPISGRPVIFCRARDGQGKRVLASVTSGVSPAMS